MSAVLEDMISSLVITAETVGDIPASGRRVSLEHYVEVTRRIKLDPWQRNLCARLEKAFWIAQANTFYFRERNYGMGKPYYEAPSGLKIDKTEFEKARGNGTRAAIHAPPRHGKSIIISQCYPAWILGYQPLHRFRLATYSVYRSAQFSLVVKQLLQSPEHQAFFPDEAGHIPKRTKYIEWSTNARIRENSADPSFSALGLQSGFTGTGADTLLMDDPYKGAEEALSEVIRDKTWRFWTDTAEPRMDAGGLPSNVFIMFHRYHQDDMGGRAIATGEFELWRYAAQADGDYIDDVSGLRYPDAAGRKVGEYLSPRFGDLYYETRKRRNEPVWYSQFQGQPTARTGNLFNVTLLRTISKADIPPILFYVRAWDNAATQGAGAYTAGVLMGIDAAENIYVFDVVRDQVDTAGRQALQQATADKDGKLVEIHAPEDPGSAGKDVAFEFEQVFSKQGFKVTITKAGESEEGGAKVYGRSKVRRAYNYSMAVNSKKVFLVLNDDGSVPEWHKPYLIELRYFPASSTKDMVDASSDGYSHLYRLFHRGLVIKSAGQHNLLHLSRFKQKFQCERVHPHWEVVAAVRFAPDSSKPSGYVITTRAAENAFVGEAVFIVAARRMYVSDPLDVLMALRADLEKYCARGDRHPSVIWINKGAGDMFQVAAQKYDMHVVEFADEATAGIPETNWYFQPEARPSPFYPLLEAPHAYCLVDDGQYIEREVRDESGMMSLRQDWSSWTYTDKGEVQPFGGITLDCVRMTLYKFALSATALTDTERRYAKLKPELQPEVVRAKIGTPEFVELLSAHEHALNLIKAEEAGEKDLAFRTAHQTGAHFGARAVTRRFRRGG